MYHLNPLIMRPLEKQLDNQAGPLVYWPGIEVVVLGCEGTGAVGGGGNRVKTPGGPRTRGVNSKPVGSAGNT